MFKVSDGVKINGKSLTVDSSSRFRIDTDLFIPTGEKLIFEAAHSVSKIILYNGGDELIGTSANTLELSGTNINLNGASGSGTPTLKMGGTTIIDSSRNMVPYQIRGSGGDDTPAGTQFSNVIKAQGTNRTLYMDGHSGSVSTWYGVGNNPYAAIDVGDGLLDIWVNPSNGTWYNIADFTTAGMNVTTGGVQINGTNRINSVGDGLFTSLYIGGTNVIDTNKNIGAGGAADANYDLKVHGLARFEGVANFINSIQVGGTNRINASGDFFVADQIKIGDDAFIEDFNIANSVRIKGAQNNNIGYIAFGQQTAQLGSSGDSALRYNSYIIANTNGTINGQNGILVGGTTVFDSSRRIQNATLDAYIPITENSVQGNNLQPQELMHYTPGDANVLADSKNFNVLAFKPPTLYKKASGSWTSQGAQSQVTDGKAAHAWGSNIIHRTGDEYIFYWGSDLGYSFMSSLTVMHSTNGNSMNIHVETAPSGTSATAAPASGGWVTEISTGNTGSWPGSTTIKKNISVGGSYRPLYRVRIVPNWSATYPNNHISLGQFIAKAGYGSVTRLFDWNGSRDVIFNHGNVTVTGEDKELLVESTTKLRIHDGSIAASNSNSGLQFDANYTDGRYRHRFRKQDLGGGIPLFLDYSHATANSYSTSLRFGGPGSNYNELSVANYLDTPRLHVGGAAFGNSRPPTNSNLHVNGNKLTIMSTRNSYGQLQIGNTSVGEVGIGFMNGVTESTMGNDVPTATNKWAAGINVYGCGTNTFGIGNVADGHEVFALDPGSKMRLGHDGDNPNLKLVYDDNHGSGDRWDTVIELGRLQDKHNGSGNYPTYQSGNGYGMYMQSNSDGCYFGMEEYTTGNFRPVVAWGDDTADSPFNFKYNNAIKFQFDYAGNFTATQNVTAYSDIKLKDNIDIITQPIEKVKALRGVSYNRNDVPGNPRQVGVIAQEVEKVLPEVVSYNKETDTKSVAYGNMVGLLIEAIKEQQEQIDAQQEQINKLTNMVNALMEK